MRQINPSINSFSLCFRLLYDPHSKGKISFLYILSVKSKDKLVTDDSALNFYELLQNSFFEVEITKVSDNFSSQYLKPFTIKQTLSISRKIHEILLDTIFYNATDKNHYNDYSILHLSDFQKSSLLFDSFLNFLEMGKVPFVVDIVLQPLEINNYSKDLLSLLEQQILKCELFTQTSVSSFNSKLSGVFPTLREQAGLFQKAQSTLYYSLKNAGFAGKILFLSPVKIKPFVIESFANLVCSGGIKQFTDDSMLTKLLGNYEINQITNYSQEKHYFPRDSFKELNSKEKLSESYTIEQASCIFQLPRIGSSSMEGIEFKSWKYLKTRTHSENKAIILGQTRIENEYASVGMTRDDRRRHTYIIGQTGTGKTTLLKSMILSDIKNGEGLCVIDPHGDLYKEILENIPNERIKDVVLLDPTDHEFPVSLNLLEYQTESQRHFIIGEFVAILSKLIQDQYGLNNSGNFTGPIFYQHVKMNLLLVMSNKNKPGTLLDFYNVFQSSKYWKKWLPLEITDPLLTDWVNNVLPNSDYSKPGSEGISVGGYIASKFDQFIFDPILRNIFAQPKSTLNLDKIMDEGKILLVNLAKGELNEMSSRFLGMILLAKIQASIMKRATLKKEFRRDFYLYVDEFQNVATQNFLTLLSEGRKFRINLILANQFIEQIDPQIISAITGNVGTHICFRLGLKDAEIMKDNFYPFISKQELTNIPNWTAYISSLDNGQKAEPFTLETIQSTNNFPNNKEKVTNSSRALYAKDKKYVEELIKKSFEKIE
ncbi:MAG: type IV secretion system DNA-binding domain-containing protein [Ignavibacteriaceae bacterium]|nr:type IV secretion system DNA-binding domain-containing protein [Ignavibacteriaceae bacterium]